MAISNEGVEHFLARQSCPYFQDGRSAISEHIQFQGSAYQDRATALIQRGWRRYGSDLYRMRCERCGLCIPARIDASTLSISDSMKRALRLNRDLTIVPCDSRFSEEHLRLWRAYSRWKHLAALDDLEVESFLGLSAPWSIIFEYRRSGPKGELLAISHIDPLSDGFSSVYFSFSPKAEHRSLGTFSVLAEALIAHAHARSESSSSLHMQGESVFQYYSNPRDAAENAFYYLGFWVPGAATMDYKARFHPFSLLLSDENSSLPSHWFTFNAKTEAVDLLQAVHWPGL